MGHEKSLAMDLIQEVHQRRTGNQHRTCCIQVSISRHITPYFGEVVDQEGGGGGGEGCVL